MEDKYENKQQIPISSRQRKLSTAEQIFTCECGKKYLTFSALYLHVKNKHDIRLTTKKSDSNYKTEILHNKKYITYFIRQQTDYISPHQQEKDDKRQRFKRIVQRYCQEVNERTKRDTLALLGRYFDEIAEELERQTHLPEDLVYYFNQFVLYYLPKETKCSSDVQALKGYTETIIEFSAWLKKEQLTETEVKLHEAYRLGERALQV